MDDLRAVVENDIMKAVQIDGTRKNGKKVTMYGVALHGNEMGLDIERADGTRLMYCMGTLFHGLGRVALENVRLTYIG